ncbi:hypothetical protein [Streptomyces cadmiisoli]|uniref:hypothetical protein n=1 Tax=Streptomyces cadmiisoli TaxID=2184053 RepID=UPI003D70B5BF
MSNDYAVIATTVIFGVLVIGTAHHYAMVKRVNDLRDERTQSVARARERALDDLRNGREPSSDDLNAAHPSRLEHEGTQGALVRWSAGLWAIVAINLAIGQARILMWAGGADPGPAPELAHIVFLDTAIAIALLMLEAIGRGIRRMRTAKPLAPWPGDSVEQAQLTRISREHRKGRQAPHPQPDTEAATTLPPNSSPA